MGVGRGARELWRRAHAAAGRPVPPPHPTGLLPQSFMQQVARLYYHPDVHSAGQEEDEEDKEDVEEEEEEEEMEEG